MSLSVFVPTNTQKARVTAIGAFKRMLEEENVSLEFVQASILLDISGKRLAATMDRFGYYLATNEGKKGKLARNTASSYYRNVKLWLFDEYPHLRVSTELILLKQGKTLDKHCLKRDNGGLTNKAPPCTKEDLRSLVHYVYSTARVNADNQDAALTCLMWHYFRRSSDLCYVQKQHVSVSADGVFYLRLLRVKTSEEQGLTLIPDKDDFLTCPLHSLAVALVTQEAPSASLFGHLPTMAPQDAAPLDAGAPLHDLLSQVPEALQVAVVPQPTSIQPTVSTIGALPTSLDKGVKRGEDSMQGLVNRLLKRVAEPAGVTAELTSHSFRRGGAQHANGDDRLAAQWIFDRGAWDMTKTNKAFAYITNTAREDRKVARVLSGWGADASPKVIDVSSQDHTTRERLACLQELLFSSCTGLKESRLNMSAKVLSVLTAYLVRHFPQLKALSPAAPIVQRIEECMKTAEISTADLLKWSIALNEEAAVPAQDQEKPQDTPHTCPKTGHLLAVIQELVASNRLLAERITIVEAALLKPKGSCEQEA
ncbi:pectin lyase F [Phytophthora nicotianae]|uniref:Pectin lyase F n=1 Tax=Phytophthora nicotianae TaxID=4792 RepID=A0A0W8CV61_PHYNI|nr:pectin lyase F [Phytophthora nicotianae]